MDLFYGGMKVWQEAKKETIEQAAIYDQYYQVNYKLLRQKVLPHRLNKINSLALTDPFPADYDKVLFKYPQEHTDMVYHEKRYVLPDIYQSLYIPHRKLMFKLMRACVGVNHLHDLWFNSWSLIII